MVAIFTGAGTGLERGSGSVLGSSGLLGSAALGRGGEQVFLNAATGNLLVSHQDEFVVGVGADAAVNRTYNSLGDLSDANQDNWRYSSDRRVYGLSGQLNTAGSTIHRVSGDGSDILYSWKEIRDQAGNLVDSGYFATDGGGAYDKLTSTSATGPWTWTDGDSRTTETYASYGTGNWRITSQKSADGYGVTFSYNADKLYRITTYDGSYIQYDWSATSPNALTDILTGYTDLSTSTAKTLTRTHYDYDAQGRLQTVTVDLSPEDGVVDSNGNGVTDAAEGYVTSYTYDGTSTRVASISQSDGSRIDVAYDTSGRVATIKQTVSGTAARTSSVAYGAGYTTVTDPLGQAVRLDYDSANNLTKITMPAASAGAAPQVTQFAYNATGDVTSVTDALGNVTRYTYDDSANPDATDNGLAHQVTDRSGNTVTRHYGLKNELLVETTTASDTASAAAPHSVRFAYDAENHLRYRVEADGAVTEYRYTGAGDLQYVVAYPEQSYDVSLLGATDSIALADLDTWQAGLPDKSSIELRYLAYDARHNVTTERVYATANADGTASTADGYVYTYYTYDQGGQLLSRHLINRNSESFVYDGLGRLTSSVDVNGGTTTFAFGDPGLNSTASTTTTVTFASGLVQTSTYDKTGALVSFAEAGAATSLAAVTGTATYAYDQDGRLRWDRDETGKKHYYIYDNAGRKVADVDAAGDMVEYQYDADNRLVSSVAYATSVAGQLTTLDNNNAVIDISTIRPAANASDVWNWRVYDKEGRLVQTIDGAGSTTINAYDASGKLVQSTAYANNVASATVANFKATRTPPAAVTNPYPLADPNNCVTRNFYDADGRLVGTLDPEGFLTQIAYDHAGNKTDEISYAAAAVAANRASGTFAQLVAGLSNPPADRHTRYVYNGAGQLRFVIDATLHVVENQFDPSGDGTCQVAYSTGLDPAATDFTYDNVKAVVTAAAFATTADRKSWSVLDAAGRTAYAIDAGGGVTAFAYNSSGQVTKATQFATQRATASLPTLATMDSWAAANPNAANRVTRSFYDGAGVLRYSVDGEGYVTRRTEDAEGRLTRIERFAGVSAFDDTATIDTVQSWVVASGGTSAVTTNAYDPAGRLSTVTDPLGTVRKYVYNATGTVLSDTVAYGTADASTTSYVYDSNGRVVEQHRASGTPEESVTKYAYDLLGNVRTITDPDNHATTQTFDHLGRLLTTTDALAGVTSYSYDGFGDVVQVTDPNKGVTYHYYDALGRLVMSCDPLKYVTETAYSAFGEVATVTRRYNAASNTPSPTVPPTFTANAAKDAATSFTYDKNGRLTATTDAEGYSESYTLNAFGDRVKVVNKLGGTTTNTYDRRGLLLTETLPIASMNSSGGTVASTVTNSFAYDSRGNRTKMVEAAGLAEQRTTTYAYDKADQLISKTGDSVATVSLNDFSATTAVTIASSNGAPKESYAYDRRGNLIQVTDANGAKSFSYYDDLDRKIAAVDPLGTLSGWTYDAAGNMLTERVYGDPVPLPASAGGSAPAPVNASNYRETSHSYDALNRLWTTSVAGVLVGSWNGATGVTTSIRTATSTLAYDAAGNIISSTDANGNVSYSWYDKLGRKSDQLDGEGYLTHWTYDGEGNVLSERRYATKWTGTVSTAAPPAVAPDATKDRVTSFTYDRTGHRLSETRTGVAAWTVNATNGALSAASTSSTVNYTYNGLGQVLSKTEATGDQVSYAYDQDGRLTKESRAAHSDQTGAPVTPTVNYYYDGLNNLTRTQQGGATLDNVNDRITTYSYGAGGRLASMTDPSGATHNYGYDAAGNLVEDSYSRLIKKFSDGSTQSASEAILYRRDAVGRVVTQTIADLLAGTRGDSQNSQYDAYGEVVQRGVNGLWQESFAYNNRGLLEKSNSGDGVWRFYAYDANGNRTLAIESEGNDLSAKTLSQLLATDFGGNPVGSALVSGINATISIYDKRNQVTQVRLPQRETTAQSTGLVSINSSQSYNAFGEVATQTDALNNVTSFSYNTMGRLISKVMPQVAVKDPAGVSSLTNPTETYYYDLSGRQVATKDANGNTVSNMLLAGTGYDGTDAEVTSEFHPDGGIRKTQYDVFGDARTLTDELNRNETRTYDKMGRLLTDMHATGVTDSYGYDDLGQRITHSDNVHSIVERTGYDLQGRVTSTVDFSGDTTNYAYSWAAALTNSGLTGTTVVGGWTTTTTMWAQLGASAKTKSETIDIHGLALADTDLGGGTTSYTYDRAGRLVTEVGTRGLSSGSTGSGTTSGGTTSGGGTAGGGTISGSGGTLSSQSQTASPAYMLAEPTATDSLAMRTTGWGPTTTTIGGTTTTAPPPAPAGIVTTLSHTYYNTGLISTDADSTTGMAADSINASYAYDVMGRRTAEKYTGTVYQSYSDSSYTSLIATSQTLENATIAYDALGRMTSFTDKNASGLVQTTITQSYDSAGNIRETRTTYPNLVSGGSTTTDYWFTYDSMNRMVIANGLLSSGMITGGTRLSYDAVGNRKTATTGGTTQTYYYDADNQLTDVYQAGYRIAHTTRNSLGQVTAYSEYQGSTLTQNRYNILYNARGQVTNEAQWQHLNGATDFTATITNRYDSYGNITRMDSVNDNGVKDTWQSWNYTWADQAMVSSSTYDKEAYDPDNNLYSSTQYYDGLGRLQRAFIADGKPRAVNFALNADGNVLWRTVNNMSSDDPKDVHLYVNGVQVAEYTNDSKAQTQNFDYAAMIADNTTPGGSSTRFYKGGSAVAGAESGTSGYDPVNSITAGATQNNRTRYTVQSGDTLQGVAQSLWGDSSLWYLIASANGLSADSPLMAGQQLAIPLKGPSNSSNAGMYRPYDVQSAVGDLSPTHAKPAKSNKCGAFGQILLVAIAVAVTAVTAGAAIAAAAPAISTIGGGLSALAAGTTGLSAGALVGIGAGSAALGSLVSQGVGVASGIQQEFSWKAVALSAVAGGISAAIGPGGLFGKAAAFSGVGNATAAAALRGAVSSALTQGIAVATGLQDKFDWAGVAAAGLASAAGQALGGIKGFRGLDPLARRAATNVAAGLANAASRSVLMGSDFGDNVLAALPDTIGQTVGGLVQDSLARTAGRASLPGLPALANGGSVAQPGASGATSQPALGAGGGQDIIVTGSRLPVFTFNPSVLASRTIAARKDFISGLAPADRARLLTALQGPRNAPGRSVYGVKLPGDGVVPDTTIGADGPTLLGFFASERYRTMDSANGTAIADYLADTYGALSKAGYYDGVDNPVQAFAQGWAAGGNDWQRGMVLPMLQMGAEAELEQGYAGVATATRDAVIAAGIDGDLHWENLRLPDYYQLSYSTPSFGLKQIVGYAGAATGNVGMLLDAGLMRDTGGLNETFTLTVDRHGQFDFGHAPTLAVGDQPYFPFSATMGWVDGYAQPSASQLNNFITGDSRSVAAGDGLLLGRTWGPNGSATFVGLGMPGPVLQVSGRGSQTWNIYSPPSH